MADKNPSYDATRSTQGSSEDQGRSSGNSSQRRRRHSGPNRRADGQAGQGNSEKEVTLNVAGPSDGGAPPSRKSRSPRRSYRPAASKEKEQQENVVAEQTASEIPSAAPGYIDRLRSSLSGATQGKKEVSAAPEKKKRLGILGTKEREEILSKGPVQYRTDEFLSELAGVDTRSPRRSHQRFGRQRNGRPVGRYLMCVHVQNGVTQIAILEGRTLIEHYVSKSDTDPNAIDGNIYLGRVTNVLPGMEAAFVDIGTPKNAVLYRGDVRYEREDLLDADQRSVRIEQLLRPKQTVVCQVTKNPIGTKGARLTQEVSLPGRFLVLIPNSDSYGISKRLPEDERKRLRRILDDIKPSGFGLIVRTAADGATADELRRDTDHLIGMWERIEERARVAHAPALLYQEPQVAVRVIREEFNRNYRGVIIDDKDLYEEVSMYVSSISPELADRVEFYDKERRALPLFEQFHVHEQLHKALGRKVWLPSGGSLIIDRAEALTVIDVNTGKNVGSHSLEETIHRNNLEAVEEIARQLRLRDIGGIIVIDLIDMMIKANQEDVMRVFRDALARDKTKTQVFDMSELGLVEMTRQRVSEGLVESFSTVCPTCEGRGLIFDPSLL
ncbi:MAG: Rne/Rng family ribonuclease [Actinomycetota bacterium]|nr:MAG: Rne/Rng family ribonuclease [Actinomycetota bacterium]